MNSTAELVGESTRSGARGAIRALALGSLVGIVACGPGSEAPGETVTSLSATNPLCDGIVPIYEIQGATHISPVVGQTVETCGVVTAVGFNSYYIQDPYGDGDETTSDGMFVFDTRTPPQVGELLRLRDRVDERIGGGADTGNLSTTQFAFPTILDRGPGTVPKPVVIGSSGRIPPNVIVISEDEIDPPINLQDSVDATANRFNPEVDGIDFYESLEGMLVTVEQPVAVSAIRQFGTFSAEVFVLANDGADIAPEDARTGRGGINLQPDPDNRGDQNPERVQIQFDGTLFGSTDYPAIQVGDMLEDVTGVVGYSFGNFEVNAIGPVEVTSGGIGEERARGKKRGFLSVASYNVLNLSAVPQDDAQREKIATQIVRNLREPDIVALQEIQDNNGDVSDCDDDPTPCSGVLDASETLQKLVDAIVAAGGPRYAFFTVDPVVETTDDNRDDPDTFGGVSLGNIRNAFLYNPHRVHLVEFTGLTRDVLADRHVSASTAFDTSRDPLEAVFRFSGQNVVVLNNHFSSRFGSTPIFGGPQPFVQAAEDAREAQSLAMNEVTSWWLHQGERNVIVLGDLNTFEFTNDLTEILPGTSRNRILTNLIERERSDNLYSFIFEGNSQVLDHIFVTDPLSWGARFDFIHVNVDFPRRFNDVTGSDHEPLLARLWVKRAGSSRWRD
jgi:predicted extracellular nuclease